MVAPVFEAMTEGGGAKVDLSELEDVGMRLSHPSSSKDILCNALEQASALLSAIQQLPQRNVLTAMKPSMDALVKPALLKHKDKDVQFLVTACISEIMRIVAPDAPYDDDTLKEIFELIVASFKGLNEKDSRFFDKRMRILDSVASVRSCVVMLDLECDDLIREMFQTFFNVVSEEPKSVILAMRAIMCLVLEESEEIPSPLLEVLLRNLLHGRKGVSNTGYALARAVFERCETHLRPHIEAFLTSKTFRSKWRESYHELIFELSKLDSGYVLPLVPKLVEELQVDKVEARLKTTRLVGRMLASMKGNLPEGFNDLFMELLSLMSDNVIEIRLATVEFAKHYLLAKPSGPRAQDLLAALYDRLQDHESGVRRLVVATICTFAKSNLDIIPIDTLRKVSECLLDTEAVVRQETFQQLIEVHREFCLKLSEGMVIELETFCWIPSKLLSCYADQDPDYFRGQALEIVFAEQLFPVEFSIENKVNCWVVVFDTFDNKALKAFERIFDEKQRLQKEMQDYLDLLSKSKEKESQKSKTELQEACKRMAIFFAQPAKAELELQSLSDSKLLKVVTELLDVKMSSLKSSCLRDDLLKTQGENGVKQEFSKELAIKCSFALFDKEHMQTLLTKINKCRSLGDERMIKASVGLMLVIAKYFPSLLEGAEGDILELLKDERDFIKYGVVQILAKLGGPLRNELLEEHNSVNLLEKLCMEGNRKQVKYAVQALYALCGDSGTDVLTTLYGKLLDALKSSTNLPTTLKALGTIAQYTNSSLKAHEEELVNVIMKDLLARDSDSSDGDEQTSETTELKILGLKMLVRSHLPVKDLEHIEPPKELFEALLGILKHGEISDKITSSNHDKAHLRLAAAKAVLKLSRLYDDQIAPQLFHATIACAKDPSSLLKDGFMEKVYKGLIERAVPLKYVCAFALSIDDGEAGALEKAKQQLGDSIKYDRQVISMKLSLNKEPHTSSVTDQPDYVLFYLVHTLAQEIETSTLNGGGPSLEAIEPVFRKFYLFIWALLLRDGEVASIDANKDDDLNRVALILGVYYAMKNAVDVVDASKTEATYFLCDLGITLLKDLLGDAFSSVKPVDNIPLPASIYKSLEGDSMIDKSYLPSVLEDGQALSNWKSGLPLSMVVKQGKRKADSGSLKDAKTPLYKRSKVTDVSHDDKKEKNKRSALDKTRSAEPEADAPVPDLPSPVSPKRKRGGGHYGNENGEVSSPETKHERVDEVLPKSSRKPKNLKVSVNEAEEDVKHGGSPAPELASPDGSATKRVRIYIKKPKPTPEPPVTESVNKEDTSDTRKRGGRKEVGDGGHDDAAAEAPAQPLSSPRGTPRRSSKLAASSGLESPKAKVEDEDEAAANELVGCRIRVWWPMDKKFYKGTVQSYQASKKRHKVVYDDGDMENLKLEDERWEKLKDMRDSPVSPSTKAKSHGDDSSQPKERKESRSTKEGSDRRKSGSQLRSKKASSAKQGDTEPDDGSNRSDNTEATEQGGQENTVDGEETLASASKRRKSVEKTGSKSTSKTGDLKSDENIRGESPSTVSKDSKDSGNVPAKALKSGRRKAH